MPIFHASDLTGGIAALDALKQYAEGRTRPGLGLMFHCCQAHMRDARRGQVIETANTVVFGYAETFIGDGMKYTIGYEIVRADKAGNGAFAFEALYGELVADALLYVDAVQFFKGRMVARKDLYSAVGFLFVGVKYTLEAV